MTRLTFGIGMLITALLAPAAAGQYAPAGNAHPDAQTELREEAPNPFGQPGGGSAWTAREKHAFARAVDIDALRDLAIFNRGRVKIVETFAREAIGDLAGRKNYLDFVRDEDGDPEKLAYDPVFTLFDLMIDPGYYRDKPLLHVEYLPLRRAILDAAVSDPDTRERWMKLTRLSPLMVLDAFRPVAERYGTELEMARGLDRLQRTMGFLAAGHGALLMVAPDAEHEDWRHIAALPPEHPVRAAFGALGDAWRAGDAQAANDAIDIIATGLPAINEPMYPTTQRTLERLYTRAQPFEWGSWAYGASFLALLLAFGTGRRWLVWLGVGALVIAMVSHTFGFGARWLIAERVPIQNQFESMTGLALGGALVGAALMLLKRQWLYGAAAAGVGFLVLLAATQAPIPGASIGREAAILNTSVLLKYHVTTVLVSYGLITLGFFVSGLLLWTHYARRAGDTDAAELAARGLGFEGEKSVGVQRVLSDLDKAQMTVLQLAFWTLGVGILLGAWWADHSWGRWWAFDPKETWALLTWMVYLVVIHARFIPQKNRALTTAWLSVLGFFVMLWTYFGVNLILPGLHAYA